MKKNFLRFGALALMSLMSINVFAQQFDAIDDKGKYEIIEDGTVALVKPNSGDVPATVKDSYGKSFNVVKIGNNAFKDADYADINVPNSVTVVGDQAFSGAAGEITIDLSKLKEIGDAAFQQAKFKNRGTSSSPVILKATTIDAYAFDRSNLVAVQWGQLPCIPEYCFRGCKDLTHFLLDKVQEGIDYVKEIGSYAFAECIKLENFGWLNTSASEYCLPNCLTLIDERAFQNCQKLTSLKFADVVKPTIEQVSFYAFAGCELLNDADFGIFKNAKTIKSGAFKGCTSLSEIAIPENVNKITDVYPYDGAFEGCTGLTTVKFHENFDYLGKKTFKGCTSLTTLTNFDKTNIDCIPESAFQGTIASSGISVTLPAGVTSIEKNAFYNSQIKTINWNNAQVTSIGESAFAGANQFYASTELSLPSALQTIGKNAFGKNSEETPVSTTFNKVTFPASMKTVGAGAFAGNTDITSVCITGQEANADEQKPAKYVDCLDDNAFDNAVYSAATLTVPYGCYDMYTGEDPRYNSFTWHKFYKNGDDTNDNISTVKAGYNVQDGIESGTPAANEKFWVGGLCYEVTKNDGRSLAEVQVVDGRYRKYTAATGVEKAAEKYDNGVVIPGGIKSNEQTKNLKDLADTDIINGTEIVIPQYVTTRYDDVKGTNAYYKVTGLVKVNTADLVVDDNPTAEGQKIAEIETVTIEAANIEVPACFNADAGFTGLTTFKTAEGGSIKSLAKKAFYKSSNLETVEINTTKEFTTLDTEVFSQCKSLAKFDIPSTVKYIYANAFLNTALDKVTLPYGLTHINAKAFYNTKLISINIPSSVVSIGANAFSFNHDSKSDVETGVKDVYVNWEDLTGVTIALTAFGTAQSETKGDKTVYHLRNLLYPSGKSADYIAYSNDMFKEAAHLFNTVEGIKVNGENLFMDCTEDPDFPAITLEDATTESVEIARELYADVTYLRNFTSTKWQCWFVPFDYEYTEDSPAKFAYLFDTQLDENGNTKFEYKEVEEDETIKAGVPYLVKPSTTGDVEFYADNLQPTSVTKQVKVSNVNTSYTFTGVYEKLNGTDLAPEVWYGLVASNGSFAPAGDTAFINAYRFYMQQAANHSPYEVKFVVLGDDDATGIESINANSINAPMFDVTGRQIVAPAKGQVYIQNGVKKLAN